MPMLMGEILWTKFFYKSILHWSRTRSQTRVILNWSNNEVSFVDHRTLPYFTVTEKKAEKRKEQSEKYSLYQSTPRDEMCVIFRKEINIEIKVSWILLFESRNRTRACKCVAFSSASTPLEIRRMWTTDEECFFLDTSLSKKKKKTSINRGAFCKLSTNAIQSKLLHSNIFFFRLKTTVTCFRTLGIQSRSNTSFIYIASNLWHHWVLGNKPAETRSSLQKSFWLDLPNIYITTPWSKQSNVAQLNLVYL